MSIVARAFNFKIIEHLLHFPQLRYNSACIASFDELLKTTKKVTGVKEDIQLHYIQELNELR